MVSGILDALMEKEVSTSERLRPSKVIRLNIDKPSILVADPHAHTIREILSSYFTSERDLTIYAQPHGRGAVYHQFMVGDPGLLICADILQRYPGGPEERGEAFVDREFRQVPTILVHHPTAVPGLHRLPPDAKLLADMWQHRYHVLAGPEVGYGHLLGMADTILRGGSPIPYDRHKTAASIPFEKVS